MIKYDITPVHINKSTIYSHNFSIKNHYSANTIFYLQSQFQITIMFTGQVNDQRTEKIVLKNKIIKSTQYEFSIIFTKMRLLKIVYLIVLHLINSRKCYAVKEMLFPFLIILCLYVVYKYRDVCHSLFCVYVWYISKQSCVSHYLQQNIAIC